MDRKVFLIEGMHCRSCEILLGEKLRKISGVRKVNINAKTGKAEIFSDIDINIEKVENVVKDAGYSMGGGDDSGKPWFNNDPKVYQNLVISVIILGTLYFVARAFGLGSIGFGNGKPSSLLVVFTIGLTAGVSTCMALVGGLVLGFAARHTEKHPNATSAQKFRPHLYFNLGRVLSYFLLGGVIALLGKAFQLSGTALGLITVAVGGVMFVLGVQLTELFPRLANGALTLPASIGKIFGLRGHESKEYSHTNAMIGGALTFFLPCGFTQAMQIYAVSSGSFITGALIMGIFALGTTPGLLGIGGVTSIVEGPWIKRFYRFIGVLVLALAIVNLTHGFNLLGWKRNVSNDTKSTDNSSSTTSNASKNSSSSEDLKNVTLENGVQIARMDQLANSYKPNSFVVKKGVPVKWIVTSKNPYSCAASLVMPSANISTYLESGENVLEFTPSKTGVMRFSCSMGMYTGSFKIVD